MFYGGSAGGGKTELLLGEAGTQHRKSLILRREFTTMRAMIERSREIFNRQGASHTKDSYNESLHIWRLLSGRMIEFGGLEHEKDKEKYRGRDHDFYGWDEVTQFTKSQYVFVNAWNRTTIPGQRCRIIATGNPPMTLEGRWVIERWSPWLNKKHGKPAKSGEIRWYVSVDGNEIETDGPAPVEHRRADGSLEKLIPTSRTFIKAMLKDNKYLRDSNYAAKLQALPEPMRSMMLDGLFDVEMDSNPFQVIPTKWVLAAMDRWRAGKPPDKPIDALGCDVARGGDDQSVASPRRGTWYDPLQKWPGVMTPTGPIAANFFMQAAGPGKPILNIDLIGWGASAYDYMLDKYPRLMGTNFGEGADGRRDKTGRLEFLNMRAWAWWNLRDALDPDNGRNLALPPDDELLADLTSPTWRPQATGKIAIESKDDIKKRLGRSTDCGDAVVLAEMTSPTGDPQAWLEMWTRENEG